jgi:hypothetical protein
MSSRVEVDLWPRDTVNQENLEIITEQTDLMT